MLYEILKHIRNFFPDSEKQMVGHFKVEGGAIDPFPNLYSGQYVLIEGSALNDGIWKGNFTSLRDEEFDGIITPLNIPSAVLTLVDDIEAFESKNEPTAMQIESFGGYSYHRATNKAGNLCGWQDVFASRLNAWRKM